MQNLGNLIRLGASGVRTVLNYAPTAAALPVAMVGAEFFGTAAFGYAAAALQATATAGVLAGAGPAIAFTGIGLASASAVNSLVHGRGVFGAMEDLASTLSGHSFTQS